MKWLCTTMIMVLIGLQLSGCQPAQSPALRLGTNVWPGYEPLYLAEQLKYYPENSVQLVEYRSASEVLRAFRNDSIEAAALTLDEALILLQHDIPIKIVLVTDISNGADVILAKSGIGAVADLSGKRVGVEGGALGAYVLSRALDINGVELKTLQVVQLEISKHQKAYEDEKVDAVVTFEPVRSQLLAKGANEIFSSREIAGEIVDVVVVHAAYLEKHPKQVRILVNSWFRALDYLATRPPDAARLMSGRLGIKPVQVLESFQGLKLPSRTDNQALLGGARPQLLKTIARLQQVMLSNGLLTSAIDTDGLVTPIAFDGSGP